MNVIFDTDFLSAVLKVEAVPLVGQLFSPSSLLLPTAVHREIAVSSLLPRLLAQEGLEVREVTPEAMAEASSRSPGLRELGSGEQAAIALTLELGDGLLLMNDRLALRHAEEVGIATLNLPAFLLLLKSTRMADAERVRGLVRDIEEKDHYGFPAEIRSSLMD